MKSQCRINGERWVLTVKLERTKARYKVWQWVCSLNIAIVKKNKKCLSFRDLEVASCILLLQYRSHTSMSKTPSEETDRGSLYSGAMAGQFWLGSSKGTVLPEGCKAKVSFIAKRPTTPEK